MVIATMPTDMQSKQIDGICINRWIFMTKRKRGCPRNMPSKTTIFTKEAVGDWPLLGGNSFLAFLRRYLMRQEAAILPRWHPGPQNHFFHAVDRREIDRFWVASVFWILRRHLCLASLQKTIPRLGLGVAAILLVAFLLETKQCTFHKLQTYSYTYIQTYIATIKK